MIVKEDKFTDNEGNVIPILRKRPILKDDAYVFNRNST